MPVTERLLQKLQETLGDEPTHDLVGWVSEGRTVNRAEVRELADIYLGRFDERLERRFAEYDVKLGQRFAEHDVKLEQRFAEYDVKLERRFAEYDVKLERRFAEQDAKLDRRLGELDSRMTAGFAAVRVEMADCLSAQHRDVVRWMFIFWAGTIIPLAGLMIALIKL
jgi:CRP-like cAMP-binding protein